MEQTVGSTINPLLQLRQYGQSPWYDYIRRGLLTSGELHRLITHDGLTGITSNPSIFEKAIAGSPDYHQSLKQLTHKLTSAKHMYEALAIRDVQDAADLLYAVYETSQASDGYVSLEVNPALAFDTAGTLEEARRLHRAVGRENVMIKVPATPEGITAIEALISQGINVNATLLFSIDVYEQVAWAYIRGLERCAEHGGRLATVASVASFFVSRIDTAVDRLLQTTINETAAPTEKNLAQSLLGKVAIANAKLAYLTFQKIFNSPQFLALKAKGAQVQRLLWASTGTKNPRYPDTYYVEELIGPHTVTTMPTATLTAFRDHGKVRPSLMEGLPEAQDLLNRLPHCGIDLSSITRKLLLDGTEIFQTAFTQLMMTINQKRTELLGTKLDTSTFAVGALRPHVTKTLQDLHQSGFLRRLWDKDPTLWSSDPKHQTLIRHALGRLHIIERQVHHLDEIDTCTASIRDAGFTHALLLGMGGSSLCPEVFRLTFGVRPGYPELLVLDSTIPAHIRAVEQRINLDRTLFLVSSKSGSTIEPLVLFRYFYDRVRQRKGDCAGQQFLAVTDPGSPLETLARAHHFRYIFPGTPEKQRQHFIPARHLSTEWVLTGRRPMPHTGGLQLYVDPVNARDLSLGTITQMLSAHLARIRPGDHVAINAYLPRTDLIHHALQNIRVSIRNAYRVATTLGYGPRFLHSTGQIHKGGPNTGVFFHLTAEDDQDLEIPGEPYTFGVLKQAQALGDFRSLTTRHRRIVRIHLGRDILGGLQRLAKVLQS